MIPVVLALGLACLLGYAIAVEPRRLSRTRLRVAVPSLREPLRMLAISDLHLRADSEGTYRRLRAVSDWAVENGAVAVLLLGDIVERDHEVDAVGVRLAQVLSPLRALFVSGNHELDRAGRWPTRPNEWQIIKAGLMRYGLESLDDRVVTLGSIDFLGIPWQGWRVARAHTLRDSASSASLVVVTHSPDHIVASPSALLGICGHTHGGQVRLPIIGAPWTPVVAPLAKLSGLVNIEGVPTYITRGLSATLPIRFRAVPEVVLVEFVPASRGRRKIEVFEETIGQPLVKVD